MQAPIELKSVAMGVFINYFEEFIQLQSVQKIADFCIKNKISNEGGANWRAGRMVKILQSKTLTIEC